MEYLSMIGNAIFNAILDNIMVPIVLLIAGAILFILKPRINRVSHKVVAKNEMEELMKKNTTHKELLKILDEQVMAAVAANMQMADAIKKEKGHIDDEDATKLNQLAFDTVYGSLPPSFTEEGGAVLEIIGGRDKLDTIIRAQMERHVFEYKYKKKDSSINVYNNTDKENNEESHVEENPLGSFPVQNDMFVGDPDSDVQPPYEVEPEPEPVDVDITMPNIIPEPQVVTKPINPAYEFDNV